MTPLLTWPVRAEVEAEWRAAVSGAYKEELPIKQAD